MDHDGFTPNDYFSVKKGLISTEFRKVDKLMRLRRVDKTRRTSRLPQYIIRVQIRMTQNIIFGERLSEFSLARLRETHYVYIKNNKIPKLIDADKLSVH